LGRHELPDLLYNRISMVEPYPDSVIAIRERLDITAFFPGGKGLWMEDETDLIPDILVLGQDFSNVSEYERMLRNESTDLDTPTWRELMRLFGFAEIDLRRCFFSNVFMGIRESKSMVGRFPGFRDKGFMKRNLDFLGEQIRIVNPKMIITLGRPASEMVSKLSEDLEVDWRDGKALNKPNNGLKHEIKIESKLFSCVALEHPSMRNSNVRRRVHTSDGIEYLGHDAEVKMLKDAIKIVDK